MASVEWLHDYGYEIRPRPDGVMTSPTPAMMLLHTTEGGSAAGAISALDRNNNWPHLLLEYDTRTKIQAVSLNRASKSLMNRAGGVETNRDGPIQVEIVGFAAHTWEMSDAEVDWLGEALAPVYRFCDIDPYQTVPFVDGRDGFIARPDAPQRMSYAQWQAFNGTCGHQHAPENDHWDPGRFRIDRFLQAVRSANGGSDNTSLTRKVVTLR